MRYFGLTAVLTIFTLSVLVPGQEKPERIRRAEYCSLFTEANVDGEIVRTKAQMTYSTVGRVDGGDSFFYSPECNNVDFFTVANGSKAQTTSRLKGFFSRLPAEKYFILELDITGRFKSGFVPSFGHLSWSRSELEILEIHSIVDVTAKRDLARPDLNAAAPLTALAKKLSSINTEIGFYFLGARDVADIDSLLSPDFIAVDAEGNRYDKINYKTLVERGLFANSEGYDIRAVAQPEEVKINGDTYTASGTIWIENGTGEKQTLQYENIYTLQNGSFILVRSRFLKP